MRVVIGLILASVAVASGSSPDELVEMKARFFTRRTGMLREQLDKKSELFEWKQSELKRLSETQSDASLFDQYMAVHKKYNAELFRLERELEQAERALHAQIFGSSLRSTVTRLFDLSDQLDEIKRDSAAEITAIEARLIQIGQKREEIEGIRAQEQLVQLQLRMQAVNREMNREGIPNTEALELMQKHQDLSDEYARVHWELMTASLDVALEWSALTVELENAREKQRRKISTLKAEMDQLQTQLAP